MMIITDSAADITAGQAKKMDGHVGPNCIGLSFVKERES